ncbi:hypothetical protein F5Y16DRAFT_402028 [Xylariaceae sp. FL0255]|nr:hypothetical protein F5Y16DRAFT_402028 [Xylariaceae sp. FL0255]
MRAQTSTAMSALTASAVVLLGFDLYGFETADEYTSSHATWDTFATDDYVDGVPGFLLGIKSQRRVWRLHAPRLGSLLWLPGDGVTVECFFNITADGSSFVNSVRHKVTVNGMPRSIISSGEPPSSISGVSFTLSVQSS